MFHSKGAQTGMDAWTPMSRMASATVRCMRRHKVLAFTLLGVLVLPMLLSPTHPIAVYGFLAHRYTDWITNAETEERTELLAAFLLTPSQVKRYQRELREDLLDDRSGRMFAVVRAPDGALHHERIRTWNSFLPTWVPAVVRKWSDRKEFTFLGDEVALWLEGNVVVALGHYHPFGGGPSPGDVRAQLASTVHEVVVSNALIPVVYLNGRLASYGFVDDVAVDVFRTTRMIEYCLIMEVGERTAPGLIPSDTLRSFLAYLRDFRHVDTDDLNAVGDDVARLCVAFREDYEEAFPNGFSPDQYRDDPDRRNMLWNLHNAHYWSLNTGRGEREQWARFSDKSR